MSTNSIDDNRTYELVPAELKLLPNWVCYRLERRLFESKVTKVPYSPVTGERAKTNDPTTWTGYETCVAAARREYDGIGFGFSPPYVGTDLDNCRNPETSEVEEWALVVIAHLDSYTEISPSGTGIHILSKGTLPQGRRREGSFEVYDSGRFFTVTGLHLEGTPLTVEERSEELAELHQAIFPPPAEPGARPTCERRPNALSDPEIIGRASNAANGAKFRNLWSGQWQGHYGSQNCADEALLCYLSFWTGKEENRMDALFRQSGLYRKKWECEDYRRRTITSAIDRTYEIYTIPRSERIERLYADIALERVVGPEAEQ